MQIPHRTGSGRGKTALMLIFALAVSFSLLLICSKNSFLYPMNDWVDVQCYFTLGRGINHGLVPYLDLYEQKGPVVYYVYALAALVSENSFIGVFFLEVLCFALFLFGSGKTARLLSDSPLSYPLCVTGLGLGLTLSLSFSHGGSVEEMFLPLFVWGLYIVLKAMREKRSLSAKDSVLFGALTAIALFTKYTFCGLFFGLALSILLWYLIDKKASELPALILRALAGALVASAAILSWYALRGGLGALWQAYFVDNLTNYSFAIKGAKYASPQGSLYLNYPWSVPGTLGIVWLAIKCKRNWRELSAVVFGAVALFLFTYLSGRRYPYYANVMAVFAPVGYAALFDVIPRRYQAARRFKRCAAALIALITVLSPLAAYCLSSNTYLMKLGRDDMPPYRFAKIISASEDKTLLNYGFLDGGFYYAAGVLPVTRFFCTLNNELAEMHEVLDGAIADAKTEFVVTRGIKSSRGKRGDDKPSALKQNYTEVDQSSLFFEGLEWVYTLYQRKPADAAQ